MSEELNNEGLVDSPSNLEEMTLKEEAPKKKHSKLGIASFALAFVAGIIGIIGIVVATMAASNVIDPGILTDPEAMMASDMMVSLMISGFLIIGGAFISFIGFVLGVIALFMKNVKKGFAIAGTIMNAVPMILSIIFFIVGMTIQNQMI